MGQIYQKECEICGAYFETPTKIRKYCDNCRNQSGKKRAKLEQQYKRIGMLYPEHDSTDIRTYVCDYCGKTVKKKYYLIPQFELPFELSWDGQTHRYCTKEEMILDFRNKGVCYYCHKPFDRNKRYRGKRATRSYYFCSEECESKYEAIIHPEPKKKVPHTFKCQYCGKEFESKKDGVAYFCSTSCSSNALHNGWVNPETKDELVIVKCICCGKVEEITREKYAKSRYKDYFCDECTLKGEEGEYYIHPQKCIICGKIRHKKIKYPFVKKDLKSYCACSIECSQEYKDRKQKAKEEKRQKYESNKQKPEEIRTKPKKEDPRNKIRSSEPLCARCKTEYIDCERMQSNFRILPKGAQYDNRGVLVTCPKYKG